jgi:uncharacterized membrane protein YkvA (DUF1232 family)
MRTALVAVAAAIVLWLVLVVGLALAGRRAAAREVAALVANLVRLFRGLLRDRRVPWSSRLLVLLGIAWVASPIDLVPEFLPLVGPLDDAIVCALVLRHVVRAAGREVVADHWRGSPAALERLLRIAGARPGVGRCS